METSQLSGTNSPKLSAPEISCVLFCCFSFVSLNMSIIKVFQVPISAVSTSSHSEQSSQARQSRWYCRNRWESRSVPIFIQSPCSICRGFFYGRISKVRSLLATNYYLCLISLCHFTDDKKRDY